jgi:DNA polymerase elongation subunit (family B)
METHRLFTYSWHIDHLVADEMTRIRVYGIDGNNENVCLQIDDFTPYIYLELPTHIQWDGTKAQILGERIDNIMKDARPVAKKLRWMKKLYGAHIKNGKRQLFPYLFCSFATLENVRTMIMKCQKIHVNNLGQLRLHIHEQVADPILQLVSCRNIPTAGWIECRGKRVDEDAKITRCDHELYVQWKNIKPWTSELTAKPLIMGYDIEANSSNPARMPLASEEEDKVFQVSCVFSRHGDSPDKWRSYLLTLGFPRQDIVGSTVTILRFKTEAQLLQGFTELVNTENPNIMAGYNILGFDIRYMVDRAQKTMCFPDFNKQGFLKDTHCRDIPLRGPATDKSKNEYNFLDTEGRVSVDLMWLVKRDYKLDNYKLQTISKHFLGKNHQKDPLDHHGIFKCYAEGIKQRNSQFTRKAQRAMGVVGKYCVQDSALVVRLMDHLQTWIGLTQMATICNIPIFPLYTEGQQVRVYSQVYRHCMYDNTVVEKNGYIPKDNERYVGAYVFDPVPGRYEVVVPLDFKSLYPCTMIAYNIDYSTLVSDPEVPDEDCHCMVWEDHVGCEHDPKVVRCNDINTIVDAERVKRRAMCTERDSMKCKDYARIGMSQSQIRAARDEAQAALNKKIKAIDRYIKPFIEERQELKKGKCAKERVMCEKRSYRWLKKPKGILPTILEELMGARTRTRTEMKQNKKRIDEIGNSDEANHLKGLNLVLEQRQLSYKICANSVYGALGVRGTRYLPLMPAAMCTTYMGRVNIKIAANAIKETYGGDIVYGDTDSCLVHFPSHVTPEKAWDYATYVAAEVTKLYPRPLELEFEQVIYWRFLILAKKQYMYYSCDRDGVVDNDVGKKGVILARRDNSTFVREIYRNVVSMVLESEPRDDIIYLITESVNGLFGRSNPHKNFVITQSIKSIGDRIAEPFIDDDGKKKGRFGDYKVSLLPIKAKERELAIHKKGVDTAEEYYIKTLPAAVQLAEKMKKRGQRAEPGSRLEFVVLPSKVSDKVSDKIESADYFLKHAEVLDLDLFYYLEKLATPLDKVLDIVYGKDPDFQKNMVANLLKRSKLKAKMIDEIKSFSKPDIIC